MKYIIYKNSNEGYGYIFLSGNTDSLSIEVDITFEIISSGYCYYNTVGEISCFTDSSLSEERKDDTELIEVIEAAIYNRN